MSAARRPAPRALFVSAGLGLTGFLLVAAGQPPGQQPGGFPPPAGYAPPQGPALGVPPPAVTPNAADPIAPLLTEARASFSRVRDYVGTFVRQERIRGQLLPEQVIAIRMRTQPFSVHMKWLQPKANEGQEAAYVAGKNNNQLRVKQSGALKAFGYMSVDPRDPRVAQHSRHTITEAGIGNTIERLVKVHDLELQQPAGQVQARVADYLFQQRPCTRMETVRLQNTGQFYAHRTVVYFDKEMRLPVRIEAYDWPTPGGNPQGELLECYSYVDLKFNVGLTDAQFNY